MQPPILYSFRRCPYAIRARMAMTKAGIKYEHREVSLKNKPAAMVTVSNKGTVPVLVFENGEVIDESLDVMRWALDQQDPDNWLDTDLDKSISLINENDFEFKPELDRYKYHVRYPGHTQTYYRERAGPFLQKLNALLQHNNGAGLYEARTTLADVAIFPFIRQFAGVDREWFEHCGYNDLVRWLLFWENCEDFLSIMQKHDFWISGTA
jgi:glutathione S-transferase